MNNPRETIANAIFNLLKTNSFPWKLIDRAGALWDQVAIADQPACFLLKIGEDAEEHGPLGATKYTLHYTILCYFRGDAIPKPTPETTYNAALDAIDQVFKTKPNGMPQTLGALVAHTWIEGRTVIAGGVLDPQIVIGVPLKVITGI
jgi:hypothetical protein